MGQVYKIFKDEDPVTALEEVIDGNLSGSYPLEDVYKVSIIFFHLCNKMLKVLN